jgi:hypothetical protein
MSSHGLPLVSCAWLAFDSLTYPMTSNLLQITFLRTLLLSSNVRGSGFIQAFAGCSRVLADILQIHDFTSGRRDHAQIRDLERCVMDGVRSSLGKADDRV